MSLNVVSFFRPSPQSRDWTNQELAEFYRVEASLVRSGILVETDRGLSDEGDPWFVFCRADTDEVIIHFARFDGSYVVASSAFGGSASGRNFRSLIETLIESHPIVIPKAKDGGKLFIHPAALLVALVTTCFFKFSQTDAVAGELKEAHSLLPASGVASQAASKGGTQALVLDQQSAASVLAAVAVAVELAQSDGAAAQGFVTGSPPELSFSVPDSGVLPQSSFEDLQGSRLQGRAGGDNKSVEGFDAHTTPESSIIFPIMKAAPEAGHIQPSLLQKVIVADHVAEFQQDTPPPAPAMSPASLHVAVATISVIEAASQPVLASKPSSENHSSAVSDAIQEVGLVLGGSLQTHLITNLDGPAEQLVLHAATGSTSSDIGASSPASSSPTPPSPAAASPESSSPAAASPESSSPAAASPESSSPALSSSASSLPVSSPAASSPTPSSGADHSIVHVSSAASSAAADAAIRQFVGGHPDFEMINSGNEVIIYDPHLTSTNLADASQTTYSFSDGSIVFLIGLPASSHMFTS